MSCHCHSSPCQCSSGGTGWNPPTPGSLVIAPPGSHVVQAPLAYPCSGDQAQSLPGTTGTAQATACQGYPTLNSQVVFPNIGASGQFRAACASSWAIPGMQLWFPPVGLVKVIGVSGDLVTFENMTVTSGTVMDSGSSIVPSGPAPSVLSGINGLSQFMIREGTKNDGNGATWRAVATMASSIPLLLPGRPDVLPGTKVYVVLELGATALAGSSPPTGVWVYVNETIHHSNNSVAQSVSSLAIIDVTNESYINVKISRPFGNGDITGYVRVIGYLV